jgi:glycosyltransferase involved in cell wall biosynthesis
MKVVHSITSLDLSAGGPSRSLPNICIGLKRKGVNQQIVTYNSKNPNSRKLIDENIDVTFIQKQSILDLDYKKVIETVNGDVFHLHNLWTPNLHWTANRCSKSNIPYIISPRGTLEPWPLSQKRLKKRLSWLLYQKKDLMNASCIHATSEEEAKNIRSLGITTPIAIIPNGINVKNYPYLKTSAVVENKTILFLSRISPKKGIETLINAWISIPEEYKKDWIIRIVGEGDKGVNTSYTAKIKQIINDKNLTETVKVVGPKYGEDKINEYKNANLFVLPTYSENFGMVIAEAMVSGVPVITTKGTPWQVLNEKSLGWWIENTEYDLKETLIEAMSLGEDIRIEMGLKSRQFIIDNYSMEQVTSKYQLLYRGVLDKSVGDLDFIYE